MGSPLVIERILGEFIKEIMVWVDHRRIGVMSASMMKEKIHERSLDLSAIFSGENADYIPVVGWNSRIGGLNSYLRVDLGSYWQQQRHEFDDDPYRVLYMFIVYHVVTSLNAEDQDLAGVFMGATIQKVVWVLAGTAKRL